MTRQPQDNLGELLPIAQLVNRVGFDEADKLLKPIEDDHSRPEWKNYLSIMVLRDRINQGLKNGPQADR